MELIQYISQWWLLVVGGVATYLAFSFFRQKIDKINLANPINHKFFSECDYYTVNKIPTIKLLYHWKKAPVRTEIFRDMLTSKIRIRKTTIKDCINSKEKVTAYKMIESINKIVNSYQVERARMGIPTIVINKFNEWHLWHSNVLISCIQDICSSDSFSSYEEKMNAVLHMHNMMLIITITDVEKTLGSLNWELSGLIYNGKKVW